MGDKMKLTREILEDYAHLQREIEMLERKLDYFSHKQLKAEHGVVQSSMASYPYAQTHLVLSGSNVKSDEEYQSRLRQKIVDLAGKKRRFDELEIEIDNAIEEIPDLEMKQIVEMKYAWGFTDAEIGKELNLERSTVAKRLKKFFEE